MANLKVRVQRVSTRPNPKTGSYTYLLVGLSIALVQKLIAEQNLEGVYENTDGGLMIYSRNRIGAVNQPVTVDARVATQRDTGRKFLNLIDNSGEEIGNAGYKYQQALAYGDGFAAIVGQHFVGQLSAGAQAPVTRTAVETAGAATEGQGAEEKPDQNVDLNTPVDANAATVNADADADAALAGAEAAAEAGKKGA